MVERCEKFGFPVEPAHPIRVMRELIGKNLDRHIALQLNVSSSIDFSHAALAEKGRNFERAKSCTYIYRHWNLCGNANCLAGIMPRSDKGSKPQRGVNSSS